MRASRVLRPAPARLASCRSLRPGFRPGPPEAAAATAAPVAPFARAPRASLPAHLRHRPPWQRQSRSPPPVPLTRPRPLRRAHFKKIDFKRYLLRKAIKSGLEKGDILVHHNHKNCYKLPSKPKKKAPAKKGLLSVAGRAAAQVRAMIEQKGLQQKDVAQAIGTSGSSLSQWLNGKGPANGSAGKAAVKWLQEQRDKDCAINADSGRAAAQVRAMIEQKGLQQKDVAQAIGTSGSSLSQWLNGKGPANGSAGKAAVKWLQEQRDKDCAINADADADGNTAAAGAEWFPGTVRADNGDGTVAINFDDGDKYSGCPVSAELLAANDCHIRGAPSPGVPASMTPVPLPSLGSTGQAGGAPAAQGPQHAAPLCSTAQQPQLNRRRLAEAAMLSPPVLPNASVSVPRAGSLFPPRDTERKAARSKNPAAMPAVHEDSASTSTAVGMRSAVEPPELTSV